MTHYDLARKKIPLQVALEIRQHRDKEIARFTSYAALAHQHDVSGEFVKVTLRGSLPPSDIKYRSKIVKRNFYGHNRPPSSDVLAKSMAQVAKTADLSDYLGSSDDPDVDDLLRLIDECC